jgi:hypothetical protein
MSQSSADADGKTPGPAIPAATPAPTVSGDAQYAARARTKPDGDVWFTIGQAWVFEENEEVGYMVRLTMVPTSWDGELLLLPIPKRRDTGVDEPY